MNTAGQRAPATPSIPAHIVFYIRIIYIIAIIFWAAIVIYFQLYAYGGIGFILILLPILVFSANIASLDDKINITTNTIFSGDFLVLGYLVATMIISWEKVHNPRVYQIVIFSISLVVISMLPLIVGEEFIHLVIHLRAILRTLAGILLVFGLYIYYEEYVS